MPQHPWMKSWPDEVPRQLSYRLGKRPLHACLADNARVIPDQTACIYYGRELSWRELDESSRRLAGYLRATGIAKGDCVALLLRNCPQFVIAYYAVQRLGAVLCPLDPLLAPAPLERQIQASNARILIAGEELLAQIAAVRTPALEQVVATRYADFSSPRPALPLPEELQTPAKNPAATHDLQDILRRQPPLRDAVKPDMNKDAMLLMFPGNSANPAILTHANALFKSASLAHTLGVTSADIHLATGPLHRIEALLYAVNLPVYSATPLVLCTQFDAESVIQALEKHRCTLWHSSASMNREILAQPEIARRDLSSLRRNPVDSDELAVDATLAAQWKQHAVHCVLHETGYGRIETHGPDTFMPATTIRFGSRGIPVHDTELKIIDAASGRILPAGQPGEIILRNPGVFKGYRNHANDNPSVSRRKGWLHTGDTGYLDADGYLYLIPVADDPPA